MAGYLFTFGYKMETSDLLTIAFGIVTIFVAVVSMVVSIYQTAIAHRLTDESNRISKTVMDTVLFTHKMNIAPLLSARLFETAIINYYEPEFPVLEIENENYGLARSEKISSFFGLQIYLIEMNDQAITYPIVLKRYKTKTLKFVIDEEFYAKGSTYEQRVSQRKQLLERNAIVIDYVDGIGTKYGVTLIFNLESKRYEGNAVDIS